MTTQFAWVIEAPGPSYLAVRELAGWQFYWSADHAKALRFVTREQADQVMMAVRQAYPALFFNEYPHYPKPVEHGWMGEGKDG